ncbi:MAG: chorismate synthase [Candidatus Omnitrophica bacterium]|nr:chorismate synthase [Candidatus Omnitrophota bacterium]
MLRYMTSGESHGKAMLAILDGMPAGLRVEDSIINVDLSRRMLGHGRGKRMRIEADKVRILSGLRKSVTIGSPITFMVNNIDDTIDRLPAVLHPRPGHADLSGAIKYDLKDIRSVLERASARETVARVAVGAVAKALLAEFGIDIASHVTAIGGIEAEIKDLGFKQLVSISERSPVRCADPDASKLMCAEIDDAMEEGDSLGGIFELIVRGAPAGLGSYTQWDKRISARIAFAVMSIQAVRGVSFGTGIGAAHLRGSMVHDEIFYEKKRGFYRTTNNAGGIEGGITTGEAIVVQAVMKPIATLGLPLASVNIRTKRPVRAALERADVCAVPAAGVIGEAVIAIELAGAMIEKFGGDSVREMKRNYNGYKEQVRKF